MGVVIVKLVVVVHGGRGGGGVRAGELMDGSGSDKAKRAGELMDARLLCCTLKVV